ncbi:hypothetical protein Pfo_020160 [Paulownia fortunei]|nr:hypothetical protein Pfo_020160 [Paulownia fortunei]
MGSNLCPLMPMVMVLFLMIPHSLSGGDTQALINQICRATDDFYFCRDVFNKHLYTPTTDIKGLTQIAITQTLIYTTNTHIFIAKAKAAEKNKDIQNLYKICEIGYGILLDQFTDANLDFAKGDYRSMIFHVSKCERFVSDCQFVLGSKVPQLSHQNLQNRVLVRMSLVSGQLIGQ